MPRNTLRWLAPACVAAVQLTAPAAVAGTSKPRFLSLGAAAEAPSGFVDMCRTEVRFCSDTPAIGDPRVVTAALPSGAPFAAPRPHVAIAAAGPARDEATLLDRINRAVNRSVAQRSDAALYGVSEFWRRSGIGPGAAGDCEDIAIEKRIRLVDAGFPADRLTFAVVYSRQAGLHTVLVARTPRGDVVLDSRRDRIVGWSKARYRWLSVQSPRDPMIWHAPATAA